MCSCETFLGYGGGQGNGPKTSGPQHDKSDVEDVTAVRLRREGESPDYPGEISVITRVFIKREAGGRGRSRGR